MYKSVHRVVHFSSLFGSLNFQETQEIYAREKIVVVLRDAGVEIQETQIYHSLGFAGERITTSGEITKVWEKKFQDCPDLVKFIPGV